MQENYDYNSLVQDAHVNPDAGKSQEVLRQVVDELNRLRLPCLNVLGVLLEQRMPDKILARIEVCCTNEEGILSLMKLMESIKSKIAFTYVRIMGNDEDASNDLTVT